MSRLSFAKINRLLISIFIFGFSIIFLPQNTIANDRQLNFEKAEIGHPIPSIPYYYFKMQINNNGVKIPFRIRKILVNGKKITDYEIRNAAWGKDNNKVFPYNWPPFSANYSKDFIYTQPILIARLDWQNGQKYKIEIKYSFNDSQKIKTVRQEIVAPDKGGYWNTQWKYYKSIVVSEDFGLERKNEPVQFSLVFYPDQITDLSKELRIVEIDEQGNTNLIPAQVYDVQKYLKKDKPRYGKDGKLRPFYWLPSVYAKIVVPISIKANSNMVLLAFYGNPKVKKMQNETPLKVRGKGLGLTIENDFYKVKLHPKSGMLNEITLKSIPEITLEHKLETNGAIHWNPGAYSPKRPWMHASDWNPPEKYETVSGPVMFMTHRRGFIPNMPEIALSITYKFFANAPYFIMTTTLETKKDVPLQAFRNGEIVFNHKLIDKAAWQDPASSKPEILTLKDIPNLTEVHLPLDVSWISFLNTKKHLGFAGIPVEYANSSLNDEPFAYNPYLYITKGPWVYWTRVLVAPYMTQNMQQIINVPKDNIYWEKWALIPYELGPENKRFEKVNYFQKRLKHPLRIQMRDERDARVRIPDEIYTDSTKTGWEEKKK